MDIHDTLKLVKNKLYVPKRIVEATKLSDLLVSVLEDEESFYVSDILERLAQALRLSGLSSPLPVNTPYVNSIACEDEPEYPGDRELERSIQGMIRWNAMSMVVDANRKLPGIGGHISTFASSASLINVAYNHFFTGFQEGRRGDLVFFQGHGSPGIYSRAFVEGVLDERDLHHFRQELAEGGGLSSYPHPFLMPDFWQFPTVSMGLGPINAIYQARFSRYLVARGFIEKEAEPHVWCFVGDGEVDEVETLGALSLAARERLDNLTFVVNCNLQRLDGPVRGNGKIIQELEAVFRGSGWNSFKVIWGSEWDELLKLDHKGFLRKRMEEVVDGDFQKYTVEPGSYFRKHFFGKYPELAEMINHLSDEEIHSLKRGGHDSKKIFAAYDAALKSKGRPSVVLAKTVKGYGLGEAGEGKNITHQQKKLNEKELREFKSRFNIPIADEDVVNTPFYRPEPGSSEEKYLTDIREKRGSFLPKRLCDAPPLSVPESTFYEEFLKGSGENAVSTTMAFVRILNKLLRDPSLGKHLVPIIPDEARTFGMESLFRQVGIYASGGQLYEPADRDSLLYYREDKKGQILEEGINEAGAMSSFISAGTAYSTHGVNMVPFYIYYSMFGFQRIGDMCWQAADMMSKGFLLGATSGRTTLNGEGLQHQDGHSHILSSTVPSLRAYDPAFAFEIAVIIEEGLREMYVENLEFYYYLTLHNENYPMCPMPEGAKQGIIDGLYPFRSSPESKDLHVQILGSGSLINEALRAQEILFSEFGVSSCVWSATSYRRLRNEALNCDRWNMVHPKEAPRVPKVCEILKEAKGPFVAVSDHMKAVPDLIAPWVKDVFISLGTDGFGLSDTRSRLRRFFEVDAESIVIAALSGLFRKGLVEASLVEKAMAGFDYPEDKVFPFYQ